MAGSHIEQDTPLKISGRVINNLRFADDIDLLHSPSDEQISHSQMVDETVGRYGNQRGEDEDHGIQWAHRIDVCNQELPLEQVVEFVYLGSAQTENGNSLKEVKMRIAKATAGLRSLMISMFLYACESHVNHGK